MWSLISLVQFVVNKAKGRISKRVFQENKARQIFLKHPFWDSPFCLITDELEEGQKKDMMKN